MEEEQNIESPKPIKGIDQVSNPSVRDLTRFAEVKMTMQAILGEVTMPLEHFLKLGQGAIFMLNSEKNDLLEVRVNDLAVGRGEVSVQESRVFIKLMQVKDKKGQFVDPMMLGMDDDPMAAAMAGMDDDPMAAAMAEMDDDPMAAAMAEMDGGADDDEMAKLMAEMDAGGEVE